MHESPFALRLPIDVVTRARFIAPYVVLPPEASADALRERTAILNLALLVGLTQLEKASRTGEPTRLRPPAMRRVRQPDYRRPPPAAPAGRRARGHRLARIALATLGGLALGFALVAGMAATIEYVPRAVQTVAPSPALVTRCLDPLEDFGTDTPRLRLFLNDAIPGTCFTYRWKPAIDLYDAWIRSNQNSAPNRWHGPTVASARSRPR